MPDETTPFNPDEFDAIKKRYEKQWANSGDSELAKLVKKTLDSDLESVTKELLRVALHATNEAVRLNAIKYILDNRIFIPAKDLDNEMQEFMKKMAGVKDTD